MSLSCGLSPGWQGPDSQHAECAAAAAGAERATWWRWWCVWAPSRGLHQNVGREAVCLCLRMCVHVGAQKCVCEAKARVNTVGYSPWKQWSQSSAGAFYDSSVFTETPPACFHRQLTVTSCSLSLSNMTQRQGRERSRYCNFVHLVVSKAFEWNAYLCQKHNINFVILLTELQTLLFVIFFKAAREHNEKKQKTIKPPWFDNSSLFS